MTWLPITYRDFYDFPRTFFVEFRDGLYLFDCRFDDVTEDYPDRYVVYLLPRDLKRQVKATPWNELPNLGKAVAESPVSALRFDPSRRRYVDDRIFDALGLDPYSERADPALVRLEERFEGYA